jgi:nucleotide-binding universal stress UspA family protein
MAEAAGVRDVGGRTRRKEPMRRPILCGVDESAEARRAAAVAAVLAERLGAPLVLLHAVPATYATGDVALLGPVAQDAVHRTHDLGRRHGNALLERMLDELRPAVHTDTILPVGNAATQLLEASRAMGAAAVVVGARGRGRVRRALLGSVSGRVAAHAPCPVVVAPHEVDMGASLFDGPMVCGVDGSAHAEDGARVAAAAAARLGCELVLVHILPPAVTALPRGPDVPNARVEQEARRAGWALLTAVARQIAMPARLMAEPVEGSVTSTLGALARRENAACVVIGSRGRGPLRSAVLGSVSATAAIEAPCPVVVVPPAARRAVERVASADTSAP